MDHELNTLSMLDLMDHPGFCVKDHIIVKSNPAAESLLFRPGEDVTQWLATGQEEYAEFSGGCLYLTLHVFGAIWSASVSRMGDVDVFLLEEEDDQAELQSMALAARELRAPLTRVMTTANQLFPMTALEEDADLRSQVARLNRGLYQMLRIIGNMSDAREYAAIPTTNLELENITDFVRGIFSKAQALAAHTGLSLTFENLPHNQLCMIDKEKLERAILNILSNAMKFTPAGGTLQAKLQRRGNRLALTVQDSGEGIPDAIRGSIYQRYLRQPGIEDSRFGIGLGMVLIRSAAAIHGGTVLIDHPEGAGTRITMTISLRQGNKGAFLSPLQRMDYAGERDHGLLELSDILPAKLYES